MKKIFLPIWMSLIGLNSFEQDTTCNRQVFTDNFGTNSGWTSVGTGNVTVANGAVTYTNAQCGQNDRLYKSLGTTLSDTYWKADFDFNLTALNPPDQGAGASIFSLTAGNADILYTVAGGTYNLTNQDGIGVTLNSLSVSDNNVNNWYFEIESKDGSARLTSPVNIALTSGVTEYFLTLERVNNLVKLAMYSDAARTNLAGNISLNISPGITGLTTIQHGVSAGGSASRYLSGTIDNDVICDNGIYADLDAKDNSNITVNVYPNLQMAKQTYLQQSN